VSSALAEFSAGTDVSPQAVLQREARASGAGTPQQSLSDQDIFDNGSRGQQGGAYDRARSMSEAGRGQFEDRRPPQHGIAPEPTPSAGRQGMADGRMGDKVTDRGLHGVAGSGAGAIYHASDAMKSMYDMGDAPSCATCGAIMTRSGSCYRCSSCGNTSGCS
jgi:hypothetical protein